jgi:formamidopyrimidine-DNA glycosylase
MPELPEVETIKRGLMNYILNKKIVQVEVFEGKSVKNGDLTSVAGAKIIGLRRFGKALVIDLDNGISLMVHLRMTGQLIWRGKENFAAGHPSENFVAELPNKQTRVVLKFEDGVLYFNDQRKFGFFKILKTLGVENDEFIRKLAKEPWKMEVKELYDKCQRHAKAPIKAVLLDQTIICGLGNIYADEALFFAKVHPATKAGTLSKKQVALILEGAREVMQASIDSGGSTMATYVKADGTRGDYLEKFAKVFRRDGMPCPRCGTIIEKIRVAGRGTHICPECQK